MGILGQILDWAFREPERPGGSDAERRARNAQAWARHSCVRAPAERWVRVERIVRETRDTISLYLAPREGDFPFAAGQFVTCCLTIAGREYRRAYSLSSAPNDELLRVTVKAIPGGLVSDYLQNQLVAGAEFRVLGPSGQFTCAAPPPSVLFIAGGSGITPIKSLLADLYRRAPAIRVTLLYACRSPRQIIFAQELQALAADWPNLNLQISLSRPGKGWSGLRGRLTPRQIQQALRDLEQLAGPASIYVCGPDGLQQLAREALLSAGVDPVRIHTERFLPAARPHAPLTQEPQPILFLRSQREVVAQPGQTLLQAALAAGLELPYSCQVGGCGHCRVQLLSGEVISDEPNCLSDREREQGARLACLSYACSPVEVDA